MPFVYYILFLKCTSRSNSHNFLYRTLARLPITQKFAQKYNTFYIYNTFQKIFVNNLLLVFFIAFFVLSSLYLRNVRRFALHILLRGFVRIRHYGFLSSTSKKDTIPAIREMFGQIEPVFADVRKTQPFDPRICPCCGRNRTYKSDIVHRNSHNIKFKKSVAGVRFRSTAFSLHVLRTSNENVVIIGRHFSVHYFPNSLSQKDFFRWVFSVFNSGLNICPV